MADNEVPEIESNFDNINEASKNMSDMVSTFGTMVEKFNSTVRHLNNSGVESIGAANDALKSYTKSQNAAAQGHEQMSRSLVNSSGLAAKGIQDHIKAASVSVVSLTKALLGVEDGAKISSAKWGEALVKGGAFAFTKIQADMTKAFSDRTGLTAAQDMLLPLQKQAIQTGVAFSGSFSEGLKGSNKFIDSIKDSTFNLGLTVDETRQLRDSANALGQVRGLDAMNKSLTGLSSSVKGLGMDLNATNAAMLVSMATGTNSSEITNFLVDANKNLGYTLEGSVKAFGTIADASKKSGIGFSETMRTIKDGTNALKMWGGTVESVTPVFNMFARSLGDGQKGLAPELFNKAIQGIQGMQFQYKSFIGSMGGMGGGSAVRAGLEMEKALEDKSGAGMAKIIDNLQTTLKQMGGGQIVTSKEALEIPGMDTQFALQRGLLTKMLGVDEAQGTKLLDALKGIEQSGLEVGSDQTNAFAELMGQGKAANDASKSLIEKTDAQQRAAALSASDQIVSELKNQLTQAGFVSTYNRGVDQLRNAVMNGKFDPKEMIASLKGMVTTFLDASKNLGKPVTKADLTNTTPRSRTMLPRIGDKPISLSNQSATSTNVGLPKSSEFSLIDALNRSPRESSSQYQTTPEFVPSNAAQKQAQITVDLANEQLNMNKAASQVEIPTRMINNDIKKADVPIQQVAPTPIRQEAPTLPPPKKVEVTINTSRKTMDTVNRMRNQNNEVDRSILTKEKLLANNDIRDTVNNQLDNPKSAENSINTLADQVADRFKASLDRSMTSLLASMEEKQRQLATPSAQIAAAPRVIEKEVKIKVTLDKHTIKLDPMIVDIVNQSYG